MAANSQFSMAVHILTLLAKAGDENVKSECIAGSVNTNAVVIRRVIGQLSQAGIVSSQTGAFGGTRLAKPATAIVHGYLDDIGIAYCGRYGDWAYIWTDQSFVSGENALQKILAGAHV